MAMLLLVDLTISISAADYASAYVVNLVEPYLRVVYAEMLDVSLLEANGILGT